MAAILFVAQETVKIEKRKKKIIFMKFMEKEVKKVWQPQDLKL